MILFIVLLIEKVKRNDRGDSDYFCVNVDEKLNSSQKPEHYP